MGRREPHIPMRSFAPLTRAVKPRKRNHHPAGSFQAAPVPASSSAEAPRPPGGNPPASVSGGTAALSTPAGEPAESEPAKPRAVPARTGGRGRLPRTARPDKSEAEAGGRPRYLRLALQNELEKEGKSTLLDRLLNPENSI